MNILMHICCGPCACYCLKSLREKGHQVTGYWYNHNIHPYQEYRKRLESLMYFANEAQMPLIIDDDYDIEGFIKNMIDGDTEMPDRCIPCYDTRLYKTAKRAKDDGFDAFTTTLLYSKYQQHKNIRQIGEKYAAQFNLEFYYEDFRKGWREGIEMSKKLGLYRQQYCGCIFSEMDRYMPEASFEEL